MYSSSFESPSIGFTPTLPVILKSTLDKDGNIESYLPERDKAMFINTIKRGIKRFYAMRFKTSIKVLFFAAIVFAVSSKI